MKVYVVIGYQYSYGEILDIGLCNVYTDFDVALKVASELEAKNQNDGWRYLACPRKLIENNT